MGYTMNNNVSKGKLVNVNDKFQIYTYHKGQWAEQITEHIKKLHHPLRSKYKQMEIKDMTAYMYKKLSPGPT
jgi:hypothetical protein